MHCLHSPVHCLHSDQPGAGVDPCVCVGCVSMSLLWSEMTLRSAAILPTVNIIQYHPTGINMLVLLLAEMCRCSSFAAPRHFLAPTRFLLGMFPAMADGTDLPRGRFGPAAPVWRLPVEFFVHVRLLDYRYLYASLALIPLVLHLFNKMIK